MDYITKTLCNNYTNLTLLGFTNVEVNGSTITFTFQDGSTATVTLPTPADGKSITNVNIDSDGSLICTLSDGTTINAGTVPTVKGDKGEDGEKGEPGDKGEDGADGKSAYDIWLEQGNVGSEQDFLDSLKGEKGDKGADGTMSFDDLTDEQKESLKGADGFSPIITENPNNTDEVYKLDIETVDGIFTTPNLKGDGIANQELESRKAIISIIDDDASGYTEDAYSGMRTWLNNQGIPMAFAVPLSQMHNLDAFVSDILASGNEIIPHGLTVNDDYNTGYTDDMTLFESEVAASKTIAEEKGYTTNICVYPKGIQPNQATNYAEKMEILQRYFDYGFNVNTAVESSEKEGYEDYLDTLTKGRWNEVPLKTMPDGFSKGMLLNIPRSCSTS